MAHSKRMATESNISEIQQFYQDKSIFITGGTGFLGKLIIEKLLRSCPGIKKIYILCRPKKAKKVNDRIKELLEEQLFDLVREADPDFEAKIVPIEGDSASINLGISNEDKRILFDEINVIIHCAASVRFDEQLRTAVRINVRGTRELLLLAHRMKQLKSFVYVSTIFSNSVHYSVDEKLYEPPIEGNELMRFVEAVDEDTLNRITTGLLGKYPNTYIYTKAVTEDLVQQQSVGLPVGIIRPSIVVATEKEPYPGWCDNVYGNVGVVAASYVGLVHNLEMKASTVANLIPADYTINAGIVAAWDIAQTWDKRQNTNSHDGIQMKDTSEIPVYNLNSFEERSINWGFLTKSIVKNAEETPTMHALSIPFVIVLHWKFMNRLFTYLFQLLPFTIDILLYCTGKQPSLVKMYKTVHKMATLSLHFTTSQWQFGNSNTRHLYGKLNDTDKVLFNFDMTKINWEEFMTVFLTGVRVYILKDPLSTVPRAKQKYRYLKVRAVAHPANQAIMSVSKQLIHGQMHESRLCWW